MILRSRLKKISFLEKMFLLKTALFKKENILIFCKKLNLEISIVSEAQFGNLIFKGNRTQIEQARQAIDSPHWEFFCDIYDGVKDFFIFKNNGRIGHISWIYYKNDPNRIIELKSDEAEIKFSLTLPEFRGKGIYPATLLKIQQYLKEKGYKKVYICVKKENISSVRGIEKAGFKIIATTNLVKIAGVQVSKKYAGSH